MADAFEQLADSANVLEVSKPLVDLINGILFVQEPQRKPMRLGAVHERQAPRRARREMRLYPRRHQNLANRKLTVFPGNSELSSVVVIVHKRAKKPGAE
jgi:hypothetical protein